MNSLKVLGLEEKPTFLAFMLIPLALKSHLQSLKNMRISINFSLKSRAWKSPAAFHQPFPRFTENSVAAPRLMKEMFQLKEFNLRPGLMRAGSLAVCGVGTVMQLKTP